MKKNQELGVEIVSGYDPRYMYENGVDLKRFPYGYVSDALKKELPGWNCKIPIAIFSDTGTGKNTFIEEEIIPYTVRFEKTILLNSGSVKLAELKKKRFDYVICDEAHFFTSDSPFNPFTDIILNYILNHFSDSVRIYMTATPDEIFPILKEKQKRYGCLETGRNHFESPQYDWKAYRFEHDYSHIDAYSFETMEDLAMLVNETEEKWAIFVDSIKDGELLCAMVEDAVLVTADSKKEKNDSYKTFKMITDKERFEERVLVTTAVLENGINIKDPHLKKVAIFSNDKVYYLEEIPTHERTSRNFDFKATEEITR